MNATTSALEAPRDCTSRERGISPRLARDSFTNSAAPVRAALALADQAIVSGLRFATAVIVGRVAGPVEFGVFAIALGPLTLLGCFQESLVTTPYTVLARNRGRRAKAAYGGASLTIYGALSLISALVLGVIAWIARDAAGWNQVGWACAMLVVAAPAFLLWEFARRMSFAHLQMGRAAIIDGFVAALQLAGLGALAAMGRLSAGSALLTMAAAYYAVGAVWLAIFLRQVEFAPRRAFTYWRRNWQFGRWLVAGQAVGAIHGLVPQWILGFFAGAAMAGTFSAFLNLALLANPAIFAVANLLTPATAQVLAGGGRKDLNRLLSRAALSMAGAMLVVAAVLAIWGEPLMILVYGAKFTGDRIAIALLGLCPLVWAVTTVFACGLTALRQNEVNFRAAAIGALVTAAIIGAFIQYGVAAGAAGLLSGSTVAMLIRAWAIYDRPPAKTNKSSTTS